MKHLIITIPSFLYCLTAWGQHSEARQFLQANSKSSLYYIDLKDAEGKVYDMGSHFDIAGKGYSIRRTDTLQRQADGSYTGKHSRIVREKEELYLVNTLKKTRKFRLDAVTDSNLVNQNLNNGYYLDHYIALSEELNKTYPLNHVTFRGSFSTWAAFPDKVKEMDHLQFITFADERLQHIKDSTTAAQEKNIRLTNYIVQNIHAIDYTVLKDSLALLPAKYAGESKYYGMVINTVAMRQPEYFFRLAEDLPEQRPLLLSCAADNKQAFSGLGSVKGHDEMKKAYLKEVKTNRLMPFWGVGSAAIGAGLLAWAIIALTNSQ